MELKGSDRGRGNAGFALVIALSLMAFVLLLMLGITTLTQVGARSASLALDQERARSNARLALMIAIGDLQKSLGPDQRVTATANIAAGADGSEIAALAEPANDTSLDGTDKGLSSVLPGTRYWTGVFDNNDDPEDIYLKTPSVSLRRWLVSGQNDLSTLPTPASGSFRVNSNGEAVDPDAAIVLVGPNSAGEGTGAEERFVAAPRVLIADTSSGASRSGAFAYWIGDEGVKARMNIARSQNNSDAASQLAQRRAWETVTGFENYPIPGGDEGLTKVNDFSNLRSIEPSIDEESLQSVFHAGTPYSQGLLTNTLEGGTQVDLTALLSGTLPGSAPANSFPNYPVSGAQLIESSAFPELQQLTWNHVQDFYQTGTNASGALQVGAGGATTNTIAPAITDIRLLFGVRLSDAVMEPDSTDSYKATVHLVAKIAVTLSNPYSTPMEWDQPLELEIKNNRRPGGGVPLTVYSTRQAGERRYDPVRPVVAAFETMENGIVVSTDTHYLPVAIDDSERNPDSKAAVLNRALFRIPAGRLEPGEAIAYSHADESTETTRSNTDTPFQAITVDMEPIDLTILEYSKSLEMTIGRYEFPRDGLQIRAGETSRAVVDLRDSASGGLLQRITDLELNNPYRRDTVSREFDVAKVFDGDGNQRFNGAVPLLLYRFQFSQPGEQYEGYGTFEMGLLGSTLRTFADFNRRGTNFHNPVQSYNPPPLFMEIIDSKSALDWYADVGGETGEAFTQNFVFDEPGQFWGYAQTNGTRQVVLFSFPDQFVSLAQLQHADMTQDAVTRSVGHQPGNAFGNSYATPFVQRDLTRQIRTDYDLKPSGNDLQIPRNYYDISYILNSAVWNRYFFSSLSAATGDPENSALVPIPVVLNTALQDSNLAATGLLIDGAFNVNSTEKDAWKAFLGASKYFRHPADEAPAEGAAFARSLEQPETFQAIPTGKDEDSYAGYRRLTDSQLVALAGEIVRQVRLRGPFVSRSHFINRTLADITEQAELSRSGALQTALDEVGLNMNIEGDLNEFSELETSTDRVRLQADNGEHALDIPDTSNTDIYDWVDLGVASILADTEMLDGNSLAEEQGYRSTGIPGWLTQADLLQVIGPSISARSDTFRIRTAGQTLGLSGKVEATAYLEAVVQRMPEYVDTSNAANERDTIDTANLTPTNQQYGRRFEIISVRWLSTDEI
jgi:Tfp pilus assembly protein PilX/Arc/MetJ-type ribon-helix-helix transcriptional regulator